ncbi:TIGR02186 family protein [Falsiroseomonas oryzae]|uniref:TIGR02186 family protein n=1 Tax=Falsiroseomonas oryzae TaxID=2766473 RepID=UPI0022EA820A|nr:TIGR02186 family protein [Roseomonas sp. MO-31]
MIAALRLAWLLAVLMLGLPAGAQAQPAAAPPLAAELSTRRIEVTTAFTGGEIVVFGATERLIHAGGDEVVVLATGPESSLVVRQKVEVLGFWINGPAARFNRIPSYWALAATRPVEDMLAPLERAELRLGLDLLPLPQLGARGPQFRDALRELKQEQGLWVDQVRPVEVAGGRLFHARLPVPSTVATGDYRVQILLVRDGRPVARQELTIQVARVGSAAQIADVARDLPVLYGVACILLAAFAGWLGSVLFRRG